LICQFKISTGQLTSLPDGTQFGGAYAGAPGYVNDPTACPIVDMGPLPCGTYGIGAPIHDPNTGPFSLPLTPSEDNEMYGRGSFLIHGDNDAMNQTASKGCIISQLSTREEISQRFDLIQVVA
jgi:hypothetical protein